ncbi:replicative DNA helicase [Thermodesulfobacteriota bacterium]
MIPPAEQAIIDCCFQDPEKLPLILRTLDPSAFDNPDLRQAFSAIHSLYSKGTPIDLHTVSEAYKGFDCSFLGNFYFSGMDLNYYIQILAENGSKKRILASLTDALKIVKNDDLSFDEKRSEISEMLFKSLAEPPRNKEKDVAGEVLSLYEQRKQERAEGKIVAGIPTSFSKLDKAIGGLQPGTLTIIGARSSHGKTTLVQDIFYRAGTSGHSCLYIGLEAPSTETYLYLVQKRMSLSPLKIKSGALTPIEETNLKAALQQFKKLPFYFEDSCSRLSEIILKIKEMAVRAKIELVVIDYIQLCENPLKNEPRHLQVAGCSRALKRLAMDLGISIVALSQLNKDCENRAGNRINIADMRESEAISHDADHVIFINRPTIYDKNNGPDYLQLAKNRHGNRIDRIPVRWDSAHNTYQEI